MLTETAGRDISSPAKLEQLESHMLELPQVECPVAHHFGPGIYIREVTLPAGAFAVGHAQRFEHLNIMLSGSVAILGDNDQVKILKAPMIFVGKPGRKIGVVLKTCVWQNVYPNPDDEHDVDALESKWLEKSETWHAHNAANQLSLIMDRDSDRRDFSELVKQAGFDEQTVRSQSEDESDQIPMPVGFDRVTIRTSPIEGLGVFLSYPAEDGELIGPARLNGMRTPLGRYTNHSQSPNAVFVKHGDDIYLYALRRIVGCSGGDQGEEVTVDYRQALALSEIYLEGAQT
jgi:SET domain